MDKNITNLELSVPKNSPNSGLSASQARLNSNPFQNRRQDTGSDSVAIPFEDAFNSNRRRQVS